MKVLFNCKLSQLMGGGTVKSLTCKFVFLLVALLILRALLVPPSPGFGGVEWSNFVYIRNHSPSFGVGVRQDKFLEVPQIVWGLNNQKIAFARACLTARRMNRILLMPSLSASLFYKEINLLPVSYTHLTLPTICSV